MTSFAQWMNIVNGIVWGPVMIVLLVGTGLYLTIRLRFIQLRYVKHSIECVSGKYDNPQEQGDVSHFQALCAALSATIGTGNIAGVATAIAVGGPGALFWMWMTAILGMATKFTSCSLAVKFREIHPDGSASGGPMYYLEKGLQQKWLAVTFAICAGVASFGIGCAVQANSVTSGLLYLLPEKTKNFNISTPIPLFQTISLTQLAFGVVLAFLVGAVIIGGIKRIAHVAEKVVPLMCVVYVLSALIALFLNVHAIPDAFDLIFRYAFTPMAAGGGFVGTVLTLTIQKGVARGVFSNESGLGSAPIAHAAAKTKRPPREGFVAMLEPLIDTLIICSMTGLVIITSGLWQVHADSGELLYGPHAKGVPMTTTINNQSVLVVGNGQPQPEPFLDNNGKPYPIPTSVPLTTSAFEHNLGPIGGFIVPISLMLFAYTTMISWSYYGDRCFEYLLGSWAVKPYRYIFCIFVILGAIGGLEIVWMVADNLNALMAIPNLIALLGLSSITVTETKAYLKQMKTEAKK